MTRGWNYLSIPKLQRCNIEVWEWISNFISQSQWYLIGSRIVLTTQVSVEGYQRRNRHKYLTHTADEWGRDITLIAKFMRSTWDSSGADRTQVGPMNFAIWVAFNSRNITFVGINHQFTAKQSICTNVTQVVAFKTKAGSIYFIAPNIYKAVLSLYQ